MLDNNSAGGLTGHSADALSFLRLVCTLAVTVLVLLNIHPIWVLGLLAVAVLTEVLDGIASRLWAQTRWFPLAKGDNYERGKAANEMATGALCILVPGALLVRMGLAWWKGWPDSHPEATVAWAVICLIFVAGTLGYFNPAKSRLIPAHAEIVEVAQAWFAGLLLVLVAVFYKRYEWGSDSWVPYVIIVALVVAISFLSGERFSSRDLEREHGLYTGKKNGWF